MEVLSGVVDFGAEHRRNDYDGFLTHAIKDIEVFWTKEMPRIYSGTKYRSLRGGVFAAYPARTDDVPGCGSRTTSYQDIEGNAFYCGFGDFIAYDDGDLIPSMVKRFGAAAVGVVFAHEFGHAIQARADEMGQTTILKEQQADCFAGAWAARAARGESDDFQFDDRDVRAGLIAMLSVADPVQVANGETNFDAHGTGFDRVGAFQDGFTGGPSRCATFFTEDRQLVNVPFNRGDPNQGNLPLADFVELIPGVFDYRWNQLLTKLGKRGFQPPSVELYERESAVRNCPELTAAEVTMAVWCKQRNVIVLHRDEASKAIDTVGDLAPGYLLGIAYAEAVQTFLRSTKTGEARQLGNDCLFGAMTELMVRNDTTTVTPQPRADIVNATLSAGDLDEAVITALRIADEKSDQDQLGTAFEKIAAFRTGVMKGVRGCSLTPGSS